MPSRPDLSRASDQEVVALALDERQEAYTELVNRYAMRIHHRIRGIVGPSERAIDLTQMTLIKVMGALDTYHPDLPFKPWIMRIAHNTAVDYVRSRPFDSPSHNHTVTPSHANVEAIDWRDPAIPTPDPGAPTFSAALEQALEQLRPAYRRCFELQVVEGRSCRDIAKTLRLPVGTVKSHLYRAKQELRTILGPELGFAETDPTLTPA